ncbi:MAG TPA: ABC transporter ATP-binding protein [Methanoregulaceae archaeon]|nr:ABC transporter ATP-binding protein [Methanoregulaceae archaeon]HRY75728.1 ABC transporter ATP-binding protein [Methanoregulaceae archaeon]
MPASEPVIRVNHVSKQYRLGGPQERYFTLRDAITTTLKAPSRIIPGSHSPETFSALQDVSFDVGPGEVVGIIGRNGAGKSTLLKILSRITYPTEGTVELHGRVGSLLEVGTGFHPELTGRENIFLSGSILGMRRNEIDTKLDEIVRFSEIERFLDTPVKRYSSGMYVRLAFAVAAHLEPEILLIDEVLAVGDAAFQKKCLGKMKDVATAGRTILFVSHNMNAIEQLCSSCILIENGRIRKSGTDVGAVIKSYLFPDESSVQSSFWENSRREFDNDWFRPEKFFLADASGKSISNPVSNNRDIWVRIEGVLKTVDPALEIGYSIVNEDGITLYWSYFNDHEESTWPVFSPGDIVLGSKIPARFLNEGLYTLELRSSLRRRMWITEPGKRSPSINLLINGGLSDGPYWTEKREGIIAPLMEWGGWMRKDEETLQQRHACDP